MPEKTYEQLDDERMEVSEQPDPTVTIYTKKRLTRDRASLVSMIADCQRQIDEIDAILSEYKDV